MSTSPLCAESSATRQRILNLDLTRLFCMFFVVMVHVSAENWYFDPVNSLSWNVYNIYDSFSRFCVPVLFMVSGALFLREDAAFSIKKLYRHNLPHLLIPLLFWATCYKLYVWLGPRSAFFTTVSAAPLGYVHLWFLYALIGVYLFIPLLRKLCTNQKTERYLLCILFGYAFFHAILGCIPPLSGVLTQLDAWSGLGASSMCYVGYFVLGHYLVTYGLAHKLQRTLYFAAGGSILFVVLATALHSNLTGAPVEAYYSNLLPTTFLPSCAVFLFFQSKFRDLRLSDSVQSLVTRASKATYGLYLCHFFVLIGLDLLGLNTHTLNPILSVPLIVAATYVISMALSLLLARIPRLGRYIV
ncbi:MAG: acyltransferase family protein [Oscillospiraceae bacterium]|nr:acyltransferase family protein [Oscillospiraceae bacterium]